MRTFGTIVAVVAALIWSIVVWGSYGLLSLSAEFLANNANDFGVAPGAEGAFEWIAGLFNNYGSGTAAVVWAIGLLVILLLRAIYNWLIGMLTREERPEPMQSVPPPASPTGARPVADNPAEMPVQAPARWGREGASR